MESKRHTCNLLKYNEEGDKKRCTNCTHFFPLDKLKNAGRCKKCWAEEAKCRRNNTLPLLKEEIRKKWDIIYEEYFSQKNKKCNTCFEIKPFDNFYKESNSWDGYQNKCISCTQNYNNTHNPYAKESNKATRKKYFKAKYDNDINFKIAVNLRNSLNKSLKKKNIKKTKSSLNIIGISLEGFIDYISNKFLPDMSWDNWGDLWELDHIKPISSFDLTDDEQVKKCFNYKNYQPLYKTTRIIEGVKHIGNRNKNKY